MTAFHRAHSMNRTRSFRPAFAAAARFAQPIARVQGGGERRRTLAELLRESNTKQW